MHSFTPIILTTLSLFLRSTLTHPTKPGFPIPIQTLQQFPKGTSVENIAVRANSQLLVTILTAPQLLQIDPNNKNRAPILVHTFPNATTLTGITEFERDIFYIVASTINPNPLTPVTGSGSVWEVDLRGFSTEPGHEAKVKRVAVFPDAILLNGMTTLSRKEGLVLVADSFKGVTWLANVKTGAVKIAVDDPLMKPIPNVPLSLGINGVKVRSGYLYFSNTNQALLARVAISPDGTLTGSTQIVSSKTTGIDDFCFDERGDVFVELNGINEQGLVPAGTGDVVILAGNSTLRTPSACAFGRGKGQEGKLYITSLGDFLGRTVGGRVQKANVGKYGYFGEDEERRKEDD